MIKKSIKLAAVLFAASMVLSSCYAYTSIVGNGADNYTIHTRQSFVNGLVSVLTFGIYTPTLTTVTK